MSGDVERVAFLAGFITGLVAASTLAVLIWAAIL